MKCLMIRQPWAHLVATGAKTIETRTWRTRYRGPLAVAASLAYDFDGADYLEDRSIKFPRYAELVRGAVIATATLSDVVEYAQDLVPQGLCAYTPGERRFGWLLDDVRMLAEPVPVKGKLGLFDIVLP